MTPSTSAASSSPPHHQVHQLCRPHFHHVPPPPVPTLHHPWLQNDKYGSWTHHPAYSNPTATPATKSGGSHTLFPFPPTPPKDSTTPDTDHYVGDESKPLTGNQLNKNREGNEWYSSSQSQENHESYHLFPKSNHQICNPKSQSQSNRKSQQQQRSSAGKTSNPQKRLKT